MNTKMERNYKSYFVESRFISIVISIVVIVFRLLLFLRKGLPDFQIKDTGFIWSRIEPHFIHNPVLSVLLSTIFIFIVSYLISELNIRYGVIRRRTSMPFYLPLIFFSVHPFYLKMTPDFIALIFILWSLFPLLASYQYHRSHKFAFQFGVLITIAGVFQIYALLLLPMWLIGLSTLNGLSFRSFLATLFGVLMVFWIIFALYVFGDNIIGFIIPFMHFINIYDFTQALNFSVPQWGFIVMITLFIVVLFITDSMQIARDRSFTKKTLFFCIFVIIVAFLLQILYFTQTLFWFYVVLPFLAIVVAHYYTNTTSKTDIVLFYLLLTSLGCYYGLNLFTDLSPF
ncbi:MAG: hypothetical protein ACOYEG_05490 [Petrimonas sp.]